MFDIQDIRKEAGGYYTCRTSLKSRAEAEKIRAGFTGPVRQINMFADLYCENSRLILEAPDKEVLLKIMDILNHSAAWET